MKKVWVLTRFLNDKFVEIVLVTDLFGTADNARTRLMKGDAKPYTYTINLIEYIPSACKDDEEEELNKIL